MEAFAKTVRLGTISHTSYSRMGQSFEREIDVFCKIEYTAEGRLSISGVEGPKRNGDASGGCGQIVMHMREPGYTFASYAPGWDAALVEQFLAVWDRYHLNDLRAGTPDQEYVIRQVSGNLDSMDHFGQSCNILGQLDLYVDRTHYHDGTPIPAEVLEGLIDAPDEAIRLLPQPIGYTYGSRWLREKVPSSVLAFLRGLPDKDKMPAWV